ncbi:MAG: hypothetical protein J6M24_04060 [Lachnospiraceae bacterium]|nr:hypothetical protein [Lachnospiraceae bacterium]
MKKRIVKYKSDIDELLKNPPGDTNWDEEIKKHLIQLEFFKHERHMHLIVMFLFAMMCFFTVLSCVDNPMLEKAVIFGALMILMVPYLMHYYLLENSVQYMYTQYDEMLKRSEIQNKNKQKGE